LTAAAVVSATIGILENLAVLGCLWLLGGVLFWGGVFFPFHLGWVGVLVGLCVAPTSLWLLADAIWNHS
jgi:hypothetical protein